jgi:hypothetical protein
MGFLTCLQMQLFCANEHYVLAKNKDTPSEKLAHLIWINDFFCVYSSYIRGWLSGGHEEGLACATELKSSFPGRCEYHSIMWH